MEKKKIRLEGLQVTSFITVIDKTSKETLHAGDAGGATGQALNCPRIEYYTFQHDRRQTLCCADSDNRTNCNGTRNTDNASVLKAGVCNTFQQIVVSASACYGQGCNDTQLGILCSYVP